jgi:hypothetical protein
MNPGDVTSDRFVRTAVRRKKLFLVLSVAGVAIGLGLAVLYGYRSWAKPEATGTLHFVVVVLVLLNARANLRQYRFAAALERVNENDRD